MILNISDNQNIIHNRIREAKLQLKRTSNPDERMALYKYIEEMSDKEQLAQGKEPYIREKDIYVSHLNNILIRHRIHKLEKQQISNYIQNKDFISGYLGQITLGVEKRYPNDEEDRIDLFTEVSVDDFSDIFYQFLKSINLDSFFNELVKNNYIFNHSSLYNNTYGTTSYNPISKNADIFLYSFIPDVQSLLTLAHETGHAYDLTLFNKNAKCYNRYLYQSLYGEAISKAFERLLIDYLINNNILVNDAHDLLLSLENSNHQFLLASYILSVLNKKYLINNRFLDMPPKKLYTLIKQYVSSDAEDLPATMEYNDLQTITLDAFGDILSMFLAERIKEEGFNDDFCRIFLNERDKLFNPDFFRKNGLSPDSYLELYEKELQLLKK